MSMEDKETLSEEYRNGSKEDDSTNGSEWEPVTNGRTEKCDIDLMDYCSPVEAFLHSPEERILYVSCVNPRRTTPDYLAVVDADCKSPTFCKVIHRVHMPEVADELHHYGWNHCVGCRACPETKKRTHLLMPALHSGQVHVINTAKNTKQPTLEKTIDLKEFDISFPHTVHCLSSGKVLISYMGDGRDEAYGNFAIIDGDTFAYEGKWAEQGVAYGYDFWYKPNFNVLISSSWGAPALIKTGFSPNDVDKFGHYIYIWNWTTKQVIQTIDLGVEDGCMVLEVRMCHDPNSSHGYVVTGVGSSVFHIWLEGNIWNHERAVKAEQEAGSSPAVFTDSVISMDDNYFYVSAWVQGYIRQYDILDKHEPKLVSQISIGKGLPIQIIQKTETGEEQEKEHIIEGGAQMLQLSIDGKRLYVTTSLYSIWDKQFYPQLIEKGSCLLRLDVDIINGGMQLDKSFFVDFGAEPDGPVLAHEIRYPGGDCTSDIFV